MNRNKIAFIICLALGILGINLYSSTPRSTPDMVISRNDSRPPTQSSQKPKSTATIKVQISGAINSPGIYELNKGSRVEELVFLAGGLSANADTDKANLAKILRDGMLISIPTKKSSKQTTVTSSTTANSKSQAATNTTVNINTADLNALQSLKGIGPVLAGRIIDWRQANGRFSSKQELLKVQGVGQKLLSNIESQISLD